MNFKKYFLFTTLLLACGGSAQAMDPQDLWHEEMKKQLTATAPQFKYTFAYHTHSPKYFDVLTPDTMDREDALETLHPERYKQKDHWEIDVTRQGSEYALYRFTFTRLAQDASSTHPSKIVLWNTREYTLTEYNSKSKYYYKRDFPYLKPEVIENDKKAYDAYLPSLQHFIDAAKAKNTTVYYLGTTYVEPTNMMAREMCGFRETLTDGDFKGAEQLKDIQLITARFYHN